MKLSRLTTATFKQELNRRRAKGDTTLPPIVDVEDRRDAIEALLFDARDILTLLGVSKADIADTISKFRVTLRRVGGAQ